MKAVKGFLLLVLHLACTLAVQVLLLRLILVEKTLDGGIYLRCILLSVLLCLIDFVAGAFLLKGLRVNRYAYIALQFWDVLLISPVFLLALVGLLSGGEGIGFGIVALMLELFLVIERSTSFVLFDPRRRQ